MPGNDEVQSREVDLAAIETACKAATPGPWRVLSDPEVDCSWLNGGTADDQEAIALYDYRAPQSNKANADFTAQARETVPRLISEVRQLRARVRELLDANSKEVERRGLALRERDEAVAKLAALEKARGAGG